MEGEGKVVQRNKKEIIKDAKRKKEKKGKGGWRKREKRKQKNKCGK